MKKMIGIACLAACAAFTGCKSIPTMENMYAMSYTIGAAAGMVANETGIDEDARDAVVGIVGVVSRCTPETNQTFEAAWTPIAQEHADRLVADGKIDAAQSALVMSAFSLVVKGIDYIFDVRYPKARQYRELVAAAVDGFSNGFLIVFKPADQTAKSPGSRICYDVEAYEHLQGNR